MPRLHRTTGLKADAILCTRPNTTALLNQLRDGDTIEYTDKVKIELSWALATVVDEPYALNAHSKVIAGAMTPPNAKLEELTDSDSALPGDHPAVPPCICISQPKTIAMHFRNKSLCNIDNLYSRTYKSPSIHKYTHTFTTTDHLVAGWPSDPAFVDVCALPQQLPFKAIDNLYTLSNLGSSGIAVTTTASWLGELVHKFVYLELIKRCKIPRTGDRYMTAVQASRKQILNIAIVNRLVRVIVRQLNAPAWTIKDVGQPSVYTLPGIMITRPYKSTVWCPRCIPDQIMGNGDEWVVCEYKTRYGGKPDNDTSNKTNAHAMMLQCIWQAMAFKLCTGNKQVSARAIEVAARSNRITNSATRVLVFSCTPDQLSPWFAWSLIGTLQQKKKRNKTMWVSQVCLVTKDINLGNGTTPASDLIGQDIQGNVEDKTYDTRAGPMTCVPLLLHVTEFKKDNSEHRRLHKMTINTLEFLISLLHQKRISDHPIIVRLFGADPQKYKLPSTWYLYNRPGHDVARTEILTALHLNT